jgi:uncharacterized protein (DUF1810 family)
MTPFHLERFVVAQDPVYARVCEELDAGRKRSHWMWFMFPQMRGLGHSAMAVEYGIGSLAEAIAYLQHATLGARLIDCTERVMAVEGRSARDIFGAPDDLKFQSSMTLFAAVPDAPAIFAGAIDAYFGGVADPRTLEFLARECA